MSIAANHSDEIEAPNSDLQTRRVLLAPICLCLVAALHFYRVSTTGQTPWKGGGFGMFSTIDSEHSRFVHAYVLTKNGPLPLKIPSELEKKTAELQAAPNQQLLQTLADQIAQRSWIDPDAAQQRLLEQLKRRTTEVPLTGQQLRAMRSSAPTTTLVSQRPTTSLVATNPNESTAAIPFTAVRVEIWKLEMPRGTTQLKPRLLLSTTRAIGEKS